MGGPPCALPISALFGDPLGAFLAETGGQILLDRLDLAIAFLAPQRNPVGDWPAPGREIFNDRMAVSKIVAEPGETRVVRRAIGVLQIFEIGRVGARGVISIDAILGEQLPVAADRIRSEERRVGKEWGSRCRSRGWPDN